MNKLLVHHNIILQNEYIFLLITFTKGDCHYILLYFNLWLNWCYFNSPTTWGYDVELSYLYYGFNKQLKPILTFLSKKNYCYRYSNKETQPGQHKKPVHLNVNLLVICFLHCSWHQSAERSGRGLGRQSKIGENDGNLPKKNESVAEYCAGVLWLWICLFKHQQFIGKSNFSSNNSLKAPCM